MIRTVTIDGRRYSKVLKQNGTGTYRVERQRASGPFWACLNPVWHRAMVERIERALGGKP